jgi:hypothetical protein
MALLNKKEFKILLTFFIIYLCFARFEPWNDVSKLYLTRAIVDEHRFEIDSYINDTENNIFTRDISDTGDRSYYNSHYYSDKPPGASFLMIPVYAVFKLFFGIPDTELKLNLLKFIIIAFSSVLFSSLLVVLIYKISGFFIEKEMYKIMAIVIFGLGTMIFAYATMTYQYAISNFFVFLCFYLILKMKQKNRFNNKNFFIAGLCGGFAITCEYSASIIVLACIILILTLKRWKSFISFLLGFSMIISILFMYNYSIFGNVLDMAYNHLDEGIFIMDTSQNISLNDYTEWRILPHFRKISEMSFFSLAKFKIILRLLFYPSRGLFFYSPVLALSLVGLFYMYKKYKLETILVIFIFVLFLIYNSQLTEWGGGPSFGPRFLYSSIPFLMLPLIFCFKKIKLKFILLLTIISIIINLVGMQFLMCEYHSEELPIVFLPYYKVKIATWQPISNPLFTSYMPLFFKYGPQSMLIEDILGIRLPPFLNVFILIVIIVFIWRNQIFFKKREIRKPFAYQKITKK